MNYQQIEILSYDRQATFLAEAEQRRLAQDVVASQVHPVRAWLGQRLMTWGAWLVSGQATPALPFTTETVAG